MFIWAACVDGSSINLSSVDAFVIGTVEMKDSKGDTVYDAEGAPRTQYCVYGLIGANQFPIRLCNQPNECTMIIQNILGNMKKEYDKQHRGVVEVATPEEKQVLLG